MLAIYHIEAPTDYMAKRKFNELHPTWDIISITNVSNWFDGIKHSSHIWKLDIHIPERKKPMRIHIRTDAAKRYNISRPSGLTKNEMSYGKALNAITDTWFDVETDYLFDDQYNIAPIAGMENGLRIFDASIDAVENDIRSNMVKCSRCGNHSENTGAYCHSVIYQRLMQNYEGDA